MVLSHHISDQLLVIWTSMFRLAPKASGVTSCAAQHRERSEKNSVHMKNSGLENSPSSKQFFWNISIKSKHSLPTSESWSCLSWSQIQTTTEEFKSFSCASVFYRKLSQILDVILPAMPTTDWFLWHGKWPSRMFFNKILNMSCHQLTETFPPVWGGYKTEMLRSQVYVLPCYELGPLIP